MKALRQNFVSVALAAAVLGASQAAAQLPPVGSVDFYGARKTTPAQVREALGINIGDSLSALSLLTVPARLAELPNVISASVHPVCCEGGRTMVYVGVAEEGAPRLEFRPQPDGAIRLADDVLMTGQRFAEAHRIAVMRGIVSEDVSQGHSLMSDSIARTIQMRYIEIAARDLDTLRKVVRTSADADHRALAAEILGYAANKQSVVDDLVYAMRDPSVVVRNNATRALALIAVLGQKQPALGIRVPYEPFIDLLNSLTWTDRNKASLALMQLTESRDATLLAALKTRAFDSIVDIAQWTNPGHSMAGVFMLSRMAGIADADAFAMFERGEKEKIIAAARK